MRSFSFPIILRKSSVVAKKDIACSEFKINEVKRNQALGAECGRSQHPRVHRALPLVRDGQDARREVRLRLFAHAGGRLAEGQGGVPLPDVALRHRGRRLHGRRHLRLGVLPGLAGPEEGEDGQA